VVDSSAVLMFSINLALKMQQQRRTHHTNQSMEMKRNTRKISTSDAKKINKNQTETKNGAHKGNKTFGKCSVQLCIIQKQNQMKIHTTLSLDREKCIKLPDFLLKHPFKSPLNPLKQLLT
jgi:hypothetical protein